MARSEKYENLNKFKISYGLYVRNVRTKFIYIYYFFDLFGDKTYTFHGSSQIFFRESLRRCIYENREDYKKLEQIGSGRAASTTKKYFREFLCVCIHKNYEKIRKYAM